MQDFDYQTDNMQMNIVGYLRQWWHDSTATSATTMTSTARPTAPSQGQSLQT